MPRAVDTNVLVRILVDDGTEQADRARQRFVTEEVFVPSSVLLETEWVLRSHLGLDRKALNDLLTAVARAPAMQLENRTQMLQAIDAHRRGPDFADAIHLFAATSCDGIYSFDALFRRKAVKLNAPLSVLFP